MVKGSNRAVIASSANEVRFTVHDVLIGGERLPTQKMYLQAAELLNRKIESCSDYHSSVCSRLTYQPLLAAVYTAYSLHFPLRLSPDAVWITIAKGLLIIWRFTVNRFAIALLLTQEK